MLIYLDNCCFNRPYDDQNSISIYIETQAKLAIQSLVLQDALRLAWSFILDYENDSNPDDNVKMEIANWRKKASFIVNSNDEIVSKAKDLHIQGFGKKDSLHLASAIESCVDYFITVDRGILKKKNVLGGVMSVCSPIELVEIIEERNDEK